jgi:hypothetical protein
VTQGVKSRSRALLIGYEQKLIIKFLFNDALDAHQITETLSAQFNEDAYCLRTVQFWVGELRRG